MSSTLASAQAEMLALLAGLSSDQDPYAAIAEYLRQQIFPTVPVSAIDQLYLLAGVLGITALLTVASLLIRWRKGVFWILRMQQSPHMLRPHWSISWSLIAAAMLVLFEVLIVYATGFYKRAANERFGYWFLAVWGIAWLGGHTAAWSLGASYILHQHAMGHDVTFLARCSNVCGLGLPIAYVGALLPLVILGGSAYSGMINSYRDVGILLAQSSAQWIPGQPVDVLSLAPALPPLERMADHADVFQLYFRVTFIFYCATALTLVMYLVSIASIYLTSLRRVLRTSQRDLSASQGSSTFVRRPQQPQVARTLRSLLLTIISFSFLGAIFASVAAIAASSPRAFASSPLRAQILILLPLHAFAVLGLPCAVILVVRAMDASAAEEASGASGSHSQSSARSRTHGVGHGSGSKGLHRGRLSVSGRKGGSANRSGNGIDIVSAGQQFSIQLAHLDSHEPFPPPAFSSVRAGGEFGELAPDGRETTLDGVKVAVDVNVSVDEEDVLDEKFDLRRTVTRS